MRLLSLTVLGLILLVGPALCQRPSRPSGQAPQLISVTIQDGSIIWESMVTRYKTEVRTVEEKTDDGKTIPKTVNVKVPIAETVKSSFELTKLSIKQLDGKAVTAEEVATRLKEATPVLLAPSDAPIDPFYAQFYKPETLVIVLPTKAPAPVPEPKEPKEPK